ncbi:hypothetical protein COO60DRAFT_39689 [Scenedesmus sp. NREL 46B-D3]|nr:hypothetical protein COO60DRAFT_39689 [Scenedesmus sp. NREL 46B-D3]
MLQTDAGSTLVVVVCCYKQQVPARAKHRSLAQLHHQLHTVTAGSCSSTAALQLQAACYQQQQAAVCWHEIAVVVFPLKQHKLLHTMWLAGCPPSNCKCGLNSHFGQNHGCGHMQKNGCWAAGKCSAAYPKQCYQETTAQVLLVLLVGCHAGTSALGQHACATDMQRNDTDVTTHLHTGMHVRRQKWLPPAMFTSRHHTRPGAGQQSRKPWITVHKTLGSDIP